ncbi:glucoamylase [Anaeromyxobacter oryzae]|uniref:Glucoamylase n=1 Tax=Anaeromyxobacter oryzae TaxID=2918170 RepID=A0ABN6MPB0_9BACT|nr:glucoamylase [Anaeromyxobacter oryzae]
MATTNGHYEPISSYALIGDCHSTALVSASGSIDWACLRRFDAGSVFSRLLDAKRGGAFELRAAELVRSRRSYLEDTNVLETVFETATGRARVLDCFAMRTGGSRTPYQQLLRVVEGLEGEVSFAAVIEPRFDYGALAPWLRHHPGEDVYSAVGGDDAVVVGAGCPLTIDHHAVRLHGNFVVAAGQRCRFSLVASMAHEMVPRRVPDRTIDRRLKVTIAWWSRWVGKGKYWPEYRPYVVRSALVLKALTCAPTGAIVAAPTTSLPEVIGGHRNWDYRYSWIRDSTLTLSALVSVGHEDVARGFKLFIERSTAGRAADLQIMYGCYGERRLPELELPHLDGYRGSRPVRVGNAATAQRQLDAFGELLDLWHLAVHLGSAVSDDEWRFLRGLVEAARVLWKKPDQGLWEMRGPPRHFVHSKVMCWVALDRGIELAESRQLHCDLDGWREARAEIRQVVEQRGVDPERGCFVQAFESRELDASLLLLPIVGFVDAGDPRMRATVARIEEELGVDGLLVRRYRSTVGDGLSGEEGYFLMASFWLVEVLAMQGRIEEAEARFRRLLELGNDVHLFAEEYQPGVGHLGNFPQAFTHIAIIGAAQQLADARSHGAWARTATGHRAAIRRARGNTAKKSDPG